MVHNKFIEVMSVPVLSTAHLPSNKALSDELLTCAEYKEGYFVCLGDEKTWAEADWVAPIRAWAKRICPKCDWVRFDRDADTIFGLEVYEW